MTEIVKGKKLVCMLLVTVLILTMGTTLVSVGAETLPKLFVDPSTYHATQLGEVFTININITNAHDLAGFQFKLGYNTTLLTALGAVEGSLLQAPTSRLVTIHDPEGYIWVTIACSPTDGNGTLAIITFNVTYAGSASCTLHLYDTELIDHLANPIPHNVEDGNYQFVILGITVATDKYCYLPGQNVTIHGNLTLDGSPHQGLVGLEVDNRAGRTAVRTLQVGPTPPPGNITIIEVFPCGNTGVPKGSFFIGDIVYFTAKVTNTGTVPKYVTITFTAHDNDTVPLGAISSQFLLPGLTTQSTVLGIPIWDWIAVGTAAGYVSAFTDYPRNGGIPYCPEKSATFQITSAPGAAAQEAQSSENYGNYSLAFKLPPYPPGLYRVYATSSYKRQSVMDSTVFGVNVICVPDHYSTIQGAINAATPTNNIILVSPRTYNEHVTVNKTVTLIGAYPSKTIIDGSGTGTVVTVTADNVEISRFTVQNGGSSSHSGIALIDSSYSTISENIILENYYGVYLNSFSQENTIRGNTITSNGYGIITGSSDYNDMLDNILSNNNYGIYLNCSTGITLKNNNMICNKYNFGVFGNSLSHFIHNIDTSNRVDEKPIIYWIYKQDETVPSNAGFVAIVSSTDITVRNLDLTKEGQGLVLAFTTNSLIERVNIINNEYGIYLVQSDRNTIIANEVSNNTVGIYQSYCNENIICHNNIIDNTNQVDIYQSSNTWNDPAGKGNYWNDYTGEDLDEDGVGDTLLPHQGVDWYPLMTTYVLMHDIAITNVTFVLPCSESILYPGWVINITVTVRNEGDFTETFFGITTYYDGDPIETKIVTELTPWAETIVDFAWDTQGVSPGNYTISAEAGGVPGETETADNIYVDGNVTLLVPTLHDVALTNVTLVLPYNFSEIYAQWAIHVTVTLENKGHFRDTFNLIVYYDGNLAETKIVTLYPLENKTVDLTWYTASVSPGNYTIKANATIEGDTDPANNGVIDGTVKVRLWGDVNGDGVVSFADFGKIKLIYSKVYPYTCPPYDTERPETYYPLMPDINGDGKVSFADVGKMKLIYSGML